MPHIVIEVADEEAEFLNRRLGPNPTLSDSKVGMWDLLASDLMHRAHAAVNVDAVAIPTNLTLSLLPHGSENASIWYLEVSWRGPGDLWAVKLRSQVYSTADEWEHEPLPSSRDDDFKERTRFPLAEAIRLAQRLLPAVVVNGMTADDVERAHHRHVASHTATKTGSE